MSSARASGGLCGKLYPNAEVRTFHNGGHGTMFLRFDEYLAMVRQFLDTATSSEPWASTNR